MKSQVTHGSESYKLETCPALLSSITLWSSDLRHVAIDFHSFVCLHKKKVVSQVKP